MSEGSACFSETGLLSDVVPGFSPRALQQTMAEAVEATLAERSTLIVEAGTGTGKTYAYLIPALLSGLKTLISTATKNLQDQLFQRDLPVLVKALGRPIKTVLLKGRANYLCRYRLELYYQDGRFTQGQLISELLAVREWAQHTRHGDLAEISELPDDALVFPYVTSTIDNCLNQECPFFSDCFLMKARRAAQEADVLVVNHHLFFADFVLRDAGHAELLPEMDAIVFDEAHALPEIASQFLGTSLSSRQLQDLLKDIEREYHALTQDTPQLPIVIERLKLALQRMRQAFGSENQRASWSSVSKRTELQSVLSSIKTEFSFLNELLSALSERSQGLENCFERAVMLLEKFNALMHATPEGQIHWFETYTQSFTVTLTPMVIAPQFRAYRETSKAAFILTSATLSVDQKMTHFSEILGLENATLLQLDSPFQYEKQALFYVPRGIHDPQTSLYTESVIQSALPVIEACGGRTFLLFTSHRALKRAAELLQPQLSYPLLIQGCMSNAQLLEKYRELGNAVLLGTYSFWEGVDIRGEALSCVIIDKLPFTNISDPILNARVQALKKQGRDPFHVYQLPQAVIALKQGVGRLIRDEQDRGVLMLCDPRLIARPYGETFLKSLPNMRRTRDIAEVQQFFSKRDT